MYKKVLAGLMALSMVASGAGLLGDTNLFNQITASASTKSSQELGESDFNDGKGLPWHICESMTGDMTFDISGGTYNMTIVNPGGTDNDGEDRWDCQFRHRGLTLEEGHTYRLTYSVKASKSGYMYAKIGNMVNDDQELWHGNGKVLNMSFLGTDATEEEVVTALKNATTTGTEVKYYQGWDAWKNNPIPANQWVTVGYEFEYIGDQNNGVSLDHWAGTVNGTAELTFHLGGKGQYTPNGCFSAGTELQFDNMALVDLTDDESNYEIEDPYVRNKILVNQVGYIQGMDKKATMVVDEGDNTPKTFKVINATTGKTVYTGTTTPKGADTDSGDYVHIIDFSDFDTELGDYVEGETNNGAYYIECDGETSYKFNIGAASSTKSNWLYDGMLADALNYFYQNRSGIDIESQYITSGDKEALAHEGGHNPDVAYIQNDWIKAYKGDGSDVQTSNGTLDVTGGWYDAGDHGKYVVNGGISVWTLQNMYERAKLVDNDTSKFDDGALLIPENNNGSPDLLDEARVEMEFMLKMQRSDGMVYHKMHDYKWTGLAVRPNEDTLIRIIKPVSTCATLNLAACGAQSYRLWKDYESTYANKCLAAAKKAYTAAKADPNNYAPLDQAIGGGAYGDNYAEDDFYWAACELYAATGDSTYYKDLKAYKNTNTGASADDKAFSITTSLVGGENSSSKTSFNWGCTSGLGTLTLALYQDKLTSAEATAVKTAITKAADEYLEIEDEQGYGLPYESTTFSDETNCPGEVFKGYEWGSNSMVVNNAIVMAYAADLNEDNSDKYANGVISAMDYIFGRNAGEYSYVTGYGDHATKYPHHRYWSWLLDDSFPMAPSGVLSGGPNSAMQDPWIKGAGYSSDELAPQLCYLDHVESWSTNECTINWNAPFAWVVSYLEDYVSAGTTEEVKKSISDCTVTLSDTSFTYTGSAIKPTVTVKNGSTTLTSGTDYTVAYSNNTNVGTATVTITGKGDYTGTVTKTFTITAASSTEKDISKCTVTLSKTSFTYTGSACKPKVTVTDGSKTLTLNTDYAVRYINNVEVGTASVKISGKGDYTGSVTKTFTITEATTKDLSDCTITLSKTVYMSDGTARKPKVTVTDGSKTLTLGTDYLVRYVNNVEPGTATVVIAGRGNYTGRVEKTFKILDPDAKQISACTITLSKTQFTYTGNSCKPKVTVKDGNTVLTMGTDYNVRYVNNVNVGTATVVISGTGNYQGIVNKTFTIVQ